MKNIILYGMRWSWKSTIWKKLASKLWRAFYDLDKIIETDIWTNISDYVSCNGWWLFRNKETENLKIILNNDSDKVISLWWGTLFFNDNLNCILKNSDKLIFIEASLDIITERIINDELHWNKRNALTSNWLINELETVYHDRKDIYETNFDFKVENNWDINSCLNQILKKIDIWRICIPIINFSLDELQKQIKIINSSTIIKVVEIRIDFIENNSEETKKILEQINKKIIITNRNKLERWNFNWWFIDSISKINNYSDVWNLFDIELLAWENIKILSEKIWNKKMILSFHDFNKTPNFEELKEVLNNMNKYNPYIFKIAVMPENIKDVETIYKLHSYFLENYKDRECIFISMWKLWINTRIDLVKNWWYLTFWSISESSAPWQINFNDLYSRINLQ